jgi:hypothetical protein
MPNKRWYNLKDPVDREAAKVWAESLGIPDLTTRELEYAVELHQDDLSDSEIRDKVLQRRKR